MSFVSRILLVALPLAAGTLAAIQPAAAQQDSARQQFNDIKDAVGLGSDRAPIDFTERPPLVVPPTNTLPPPVASSESSTIRDPDEIARRKALTDSRRPVPPTDPGAAATGLGARAYLIDPPSGLRDPAAVASERDFDKSGAAEKKPAHRRHAKRKPVRATEQAAQ